MVGPNLAALPLGFPCHLFRVLRRPRPLAARSRAQPSPARNQCVHQVPTTRPIAIARVLWDVDNLHPASLAEFEALSMLVTAHLSQLTGCVPSLTAFANPTTLHRLTAAATLPAATSAAAAALRGVGGALVPTSGRRQSSDLAMRSALHDFVQQHGDQCSGLTVACVSDDTGFAPALRRCAALGCFTVAIGQFRQRRRRPVGKVKPLASLTLPAAAHAAIALKTTATGGWEVEEVWLNPGS